MKDLQLDALSWLTQLLVFHTALKSEVSLALIEQFYKARLLHSPADRTRSGAKSMLHYNQPQRNSYCPRIL